MREAGRGSIVNVSSIDGMTTKSGLIAYSGEQVGAARHDARGGASSSGSYGVRVNAVCPEAGSAGDVRGPTCRRASTPELAASFSQRILEDADEALARREDRTTSRA